MAAQSTLKNMALCLSAVCLICSAVVGGAYAVTKSPIEEAAKAKTTASVARVLPAFTAEPELGSLELNGANWNAEAEEALASGATAVVTERRGLTLVVKAC